MIFPDLRLTGMKPTKDRIFADSNILLYLLSNDERKKGIALKILEAIPVISTQVLSENINILFKKFKNLSGKQIAMHLNMLTYYCEITSVNTQTIDTALQLKIKYKYQWYDSTILSSAILTGCNILYSEDMHHGQLIEERLQIINPFRQ